MNNKLISVYLVSTAASMFAQVSPTAVGPRSVVRQVDHIIVQVDTVANAKSLWSVFSKTLNLPIAWPPADYKGFFSGGVNVGNVNLEFAYFKDESAPASSLGDRVANARFGGLGLEPVPLAEAVARLVELRLRHSKPDAYQQAQDETGKKLILWTTVYLDELSKNMDIFLCEYSNDLFRTDNPPRRDIQDNRRYLTDQLKQRNGGPMGIDSIKEIVIETSNYETIASLWGKLLNEKTPPPGEELKASQGPALRLVPSGSDTIRSIVVRVADLGRARRFLKENGLLGEDLKDRIVIDPAKLMGIDVQFVE